MRTKKNILAKTDEKNNTLLNKATITSFGKNIKCKFILIYLFTILFLEKTDSKKSIVSKANVLKTCNDFS